MERILRSCLQVGNTPDSEEALSNWHKLVEHRIGFNIEEDKRIFQYLENFYGQMSAPPDFSIIREYFEKKDDIETCSRLDEIKKAQFYIRTNFLSIVRSELESQQIKSFIIACRDAATIAEFGRNLEKPIEGKKIMRGVQDAMGFMFDKMSSFSHFESGEKLEGFIEEDVEEFLDEYDQTTKQESYSGRNIFGLDPVDSAGDGHKSGEFWVHCAFPGELKCVPGRSIIFDHRTGCRRTIEEMYWTKQLPMVTALENEGKGELRLVSAETSHLVQNGVREVYTLNLVSGRKVSSTSNHKFFTKTGWKELSDIVDSDFVAIPNKLGTNTFCNRWLDHEIQLCGFLIRDTFISIMNGDDNAVKLAFVSCSRAFASLNNEIRSKYEFFERHVVAQRIPDEYFGLNPIQSQLFLEALIGKLSIGVKIPRNPNLSDLLCKDIQSFLLKVGIHSIINDQYIEIIEPTDFQDDVVWDKVQWVEYNGEEMTYDLSVPNHHSFVVDDVISHNTSLALNYAYNNSYLFGKNIFYGIFEMPYKQLRRQLYVIHSSHGKFVTDWYRKDLKNGRENPYLGLDYRKVRDGKLDELEYERLKIIAQDFKSNSKGKLFVWRPAMQVGSEEVRKKAEMFHNKYGCDGIILDNIGNMKPKFRTNDFVTMINSVVTECRFLALNFARGNTVPVLGLFHMNRQGKLRADKAEGRYDSAAISYANQLEKDADVITYTYLNDQLRQQGQFYMGCIKNRDNPVFPQFTGKVIWNTKRMRAIESSMLDMTQDRILAASQQISLTVDDMI